MADDNKSMRYLNPNAVKTDHKHTCHLCCANSRCAF